MAYFSQEMKKEKSVAIKALCKKHNVKASLSVSNSAKVHLTIKSGKIDFLGAGLNDRNKRDGYTPTGRVQVNHYYIDTTFRGEAAEFLTAAKNILNAGNYDRSDSQSDYFDVGYYISISLGGDEAYSLVG
jgi:hypothetical protein